MGETFMETVVRNWRGFKSFMWNSSTNEFMGRGAKSWGEIGLFYLVFYACLGLWWGLLLFLRVTTLPDTNEGPLRTEYLSHRGAGLNVVPVGRNWELRVKYNIKNANTFNYYTDRITEFLSEYKTINGSENDVFTTCPPEKQDECLNLNEADRAFVYIDAPRLNNETLAYNLLNLGECLNDDGWAQGSPCFYFRINRVWNWSPSKLSPGSRKDRKYIGDVSQLSDEFAPLRCHGMKEADRNKIEQIKLYPERGFRREFFPWVGQKDFRSPVVAAKIFLKPESYGKKVRIECVILADNIFRASEKPNIGRADIELTIMDNE